MVTGLFALLLGVDAAAGARLVPGGLRRRGRVGRAAQHAGHERSSPTAALMASKPYVASGQYIERMSNYCTRLPLRPGAAHRRRTPARSPRCTGTSCCATRRCWRANPRMAHAAEERWLALMRTSAGASPTGLRRSRWGAGPLKADASGSAPGAPAALHSVDAIAGRPRTRVLIHPPRRVVCLPMTRGAEESCRCLCVNLSNT
ncbi:MAG: hypothetical protein MZW92_07590 [Comamonadaceae bacterium]|nr:hypothetical protein [Comamonadaceae bacterium]